MLDRCPPDYRGAAVLRRRPRVLAALTAWHLQAQEAGLRSALGGVRTALRDEGATAVDETVALLEAELVRVQGARRSLRVIAGALASGGAGAPDA
jgi:hypothetical protein